MTDRLKLLLVHVFSLHTLIMAIGWGITITGGAVPALAKYHALFVAIGVLFNVGGISMAANTDPEVFKMRAGIRKPSLGGPTSASLRLVPLFFALPLTALLSACSFGQCLLNHFSASQETLLVDATAALSGASWEADLAGLVGVAGEATLDCTVQAIVQHEQAKRDALAKIEQTYHPAAQLPISPILVHGTEWLGKHPAHACKEPPRPKQIATISGSAPVGGAS